MIDKNTFGARLEAKRKDKGLTQEGLAALIGDCSKQVVSGWENNKYEPTIMKLRKLAELLDTTSSYLLDGFVGYGLKEGYVAVVAIIKTLQH